MQELPREQARGGFVAGYSDSCFSRDRADRFGASESWDRKEPFDIQAHSREHDKAEADRRRLSDPRSIR